MGKNSIFVVQLHCVDAQKYINMEEKAKKTYYFGVLIPSNETCISTSVTGIAKFLGVSRQTIYSNLTQSSYYQSLRYRVAKVTDFRKMNRRLSVMSKSVQLHRVDAQS